MPSEPEPESQARYTVPDLGPETGIHARILPDARKKGTLHTALPIPLSVLAPAPWHRGSDRARKGGISVLNCTAIGSPVALIKVSSIG